MPDGFKIATAWVEVKADDANLGADLKTDIEKAAANKKFKIPITSVSKGLQASVEEAIKKAGANKKFKIPITSVSKGLRAAVTTAVEEAGKNQQIDVTVDADTAGLNATLAAAVTAAEAAHRINVPIVGDDTDLRQSVTIAAQLAEDGQRITVPITAGDSDLRQAIDDALRTAEAGHTITVPINVNDTGLRTSITTAIDTATAGQRIDVDIDIDDTRLGPRITTAIATASKGKRVRVPVTADVHGFRDSIREAVNFAAANQKIEIPTAVKDPMELRRQVQAAVRWAAWGHRIDIGVNLNTTAALAQIAALHSAMQGLNVTVRTGSNAVASASTNWKMYGAIALAVLAGITVAAPMAAAAITATLPIAFGAIGAFALKSNQEVRSAFADMKTQVAADIREAAEPFKPFLIDAMDEVTDSVQDLKGPLSETFRAAGPLVDELADGVVSLGERALPGITAALERSGPATQQFSEFLGQVGDGLGGMFDQITRGNELNLARVWESMGTGTEDLLVSLGNMLGELTRNQSALRSIDALFAGLVATVNSVTNVLDMAAPAIEGVLSAFAGGAQGIAWVTEQYRGMFEVIATGSNTGTGSITRMKTGMDGTRVSSDLLADSSKKVSDALAAQRQNADHLITSLWGLANASQGTIDAQAAMEQAIDDAMASARDHAGALDMVNGKLNLNGQEARDAWADISQLATATKKVGQETYATTGSWAAAEAAMKRGRAAFINAADGAGLTRAEARKLANELIALPDGKTRVELEREDALNGLDDVQAAIKKTPGAKSVKVSTLSKAAIAALEAVGLKTRRLPDGRTEVYTANGQSLGSIGAVNRALNNLDGKTASTYTTHYVSTITRNHFYNVPLLKEAEGGPVRFARGGGVRGFPGGGAVYGPGTATSDSILAALSNGEFVIKAAMVARYGPKMLAAINEGRFPQIRGFAKGGLSTKQKDARKSLTADTTLTDMSHIAGVRNAEVSSGLFKERSETALVDFLNKMQRDVAAAGFSKSTNSRLQAQITSSARSLFAQNDALDKVTKSLEKARETVDDLRGKFDSLKSSVSSSLVGFANVTKIGKFGTSVGTLLGQMRSDTARTGQFTGQLDKLKSMGLNATMLSDIAAAGVTGGGAATATSLLGATPAQIAELNKLQGQLVKSADAAGSTVANSMFGAGIRAAEGLVRGLESQEKAIEASMMRIAKSMEAAIKKALGIRSPSEEMRKLGAMTAQGFTLGIEQERGPVRAANRMAHAPVAATTGIAAGDTGFGPTGSAPTINNHITINGGDLTTAAERKRIANLMARETNNALRKFQQERARR